MCKTSALLGRCQPFTAQIHFHSQLGDGPNSPHHVSWKTLQDRLGTGRSRRRRTAFTIPAERRSALQYLATGRAGAPLVQSEGVRDTGGLTRTGSHQRKAAGWRLGGCRVSRQGAELCSCGPACGVLWPVHPQLGPAKVRMASRIQIRPPSRGTRGLAQEAAGRTPQWEAHDPCWAGGGPR